MSDKEFQKVLDNLSTKHDEYLTVLKIAEDEYVRRIGHHPSDADDDYWIDTYHVSSGISTVSQVMKHAKECEPRNF